MVDPTTSALLGACSHFSDTLLVACRYRRPLPEFALDRLERPLERRVLTVHAVDDDEQALEVAAAVAFLAGDDASFVTGLELYISTSLPLSPGTYPEVNRDCCGSLIFTMNAILPTPLEISNSW